MQAGVGYFCSTEHLWAKNGLHLYDYFQQKILRIRKIEEMHKKGYKNVPLKSKGGNFWNT
ncbi:hypothetical protein KIN20_013967 [Parelaphostrongylus tenuis]|uniref:Uncharacterized protein n=1 Tax=Parelaphostrongylus tenuis TaxID=148309 RepID=A0AAD5MEB0_PARTN|nr:hypothetical protein KIN20_013967 [Parelaphostrongylus tenuis]